MPEYLIYVQYGCFMILFVIGLYHMYTRGVTQGCAYTLRRLDEEKVIDFSGEEAKAYPGKNTKGFYFKRGW